MAATIRRLHEMELTPLIVGGPADDEIMKRLAEQGLDDVPVLQHPPLETLAGVLVHACVFLGHDSGVTHLAAALQVPTVALFGPTDPLQWAPRGGHVFIVRGGLCTCRDQAQVRACSDRPCLPSSPETMVETVTAALMRYHSVTKT
jgi:ADP-heptose:LPS heptosyltransferase